MYCTIVIVDLGANSSCTTSLGSLSSSGLSCGVISDSNTLNQYEVSVDCGGGTTVSPSLMPNKTYISTDNLPDSTTVHINAHDGTNCLSNPISVVDAQRSAYSTTVYYLA